MRISIKEVEKLKNQGKTPAEIAKILGADEIKIKRHIYRIKHLGKTPQKDKLSFENLDSAIDFWIERLKDSKRVIILETDNKLLAKDNERLNNELSACRDKVKKLTQKQEAYVLAVKQGSVKEPVS